MANDRHLTGHFVSSRYPKWPHTLVVRPLSCTRQPINLEIEARTIHLSGDTEP